MFTSKCNGIKDKYVRYTSEELKSGKAPDGIYQGRDAEYFQIVVSKKRGQTAYKGWLVGEDAVAILTYHPESGILQPGTPSPGASWKYLPNHQVVFDVVSPK